MIWILVFCRVLALISVQSNTVTSPQIRILDVATKASETRLIPQHYENRNFRPHFHHFEDVQRPFKSYVIYDEFPFRVFKEWRANSPQNPPNRQPSPYLEIKKQPDAEWMPDFYYQNGHQILPPPKPTLAYRSVFSNIIKVFDENPDDLNRNRYPSKFSRPDDSYWEPAFESEEELYPPNIIRRPFGDQKYPDNYPRVFYPNEKFHFNQEIYKPPKFSYPQEGFYDTHTINYNQNDYKTEEAEVLQDGILKENNKKRVYLCSFIKLNDKQFPKEGDPCGRSESEAPVLAPDYPDLSHLPNDKIPVEHRRQHYQSKRIKRSLHREKRSPEFSYWESPFGYGNEYSDDGYFSDYYRSRGNYNRNRNRNQNYRNRYYNGNRANYEEYDDDFQNGDSNRGLSSYLTNTGRRYKNRRNNNDDDDDDNNNNNNDDNDNNNNDNNHDYDSNEDMDRQNSNNRRGNNDRRKNEDSRDRRRNNNNNNNNNNNDDDDYRDRRNNNRQSNSRRYNNKRYYNDYNNRNRYYGNSNNGYYGGSGGYYGNGYGSSYGGNGYGGSYGNNGYGGSYSGNGYSGNGYSGYGYNGGYGGYGSGSGFGSF